MKKIILNLGKILILSKNWFKSLARWKKILIFCGLGLVVLFGLFSYSLKSDLWKKFPKSWRAFIAFNKLGLSAYNEPICHEDCYYTRQIYKTIIASNLEQEKFYKKIEAVILDESENLIWRQELVLALKIFKAEAPGYLSDYLNNQGGETDLKNLISHEFNLNSLAETSDLVKTIKNKNLTEANRLNALLRLDVSNPEIKFDFYLDLLLNDPSLKIRDQALSALSNFPDREKYLNSDLFNKLKDLLMNSETDRYLKKSLLAYLTVYLKIDEPSLVQLLLDVYRDEINFDKFTRAAAAEILNRHTSNSYDEPEITATEWEEYQNNSISARAFKD